jgi:hypothetical protein
MLLRSTSKRANLSRPGTDRERVCLSPVGEQGEILRTISDVRQPHLQRGNAVDLWKVGGCVEEARREHDGKVGAAPLDPRRAMMLRTADV